MSLPGRVRRAVLLVALATLAFLLAPAGVLGHTITEKYNAPLPIVAYVAGAALAVAMSFVFVSLRGRRQAPQPPTAGTPREVPRWLRWLLRALGLTAWLWIMAQAFLGGSDPAADVAQILLWVFGWIGVALASALIGPVWAWLDPFSTIHILLVGAGRRLGLLSEPDESGEGPFAERRFPTRIGRRLAIVGFVALIWLELVAFVTGGRTLALLLLGYTLLTLAGMAYFGRAAWRRNGEIFSIWFAVLGRLAPLALAGEPEDNRVVRRPFASGLFSAWGRSELVLVALGTGAIIFDGLSQTTPYFDLFGRLNPLGLPTLAVNTVVMVAWLALVVAVVIAVAARVGIDALGAGLLPVAVGYLVAHYFLALLFDGQRILIALNDPLVRGDSLSPYPLSDMTEPWVFLPASVIWSIQLAAVVGGHVLGAWAGHAALSRNRSGEAPLALQLPLAVLMVVLTSVTLWSLGQAVIDDQPEAGAVAPPAMMGSPRQSPAT